MAEITRARLQADLESVRVAEIYAANPLLEKLDVPRFRLPEVKLEIPVVIAETRECASDTGEDIDGPTLIQSFQQVFLDCQEDLPITLPTRARARLTTACRRKVDELLAAGQTPLITLADALVEVTGAFLEAYKPRKGKLTAEARTEWLGAFRGRLRTAFLGLVKDPPRIYIEGTAKDLREAGDCIARLTLSVSEEALEWQFVDDDGERRAFLTPE
jgi:hypothetical protein